MADYLNFGEIKSAIARTIKDYDESIATMIGEIANQVYMSELIEADDLYPLHWLRKYDDSKRAITPATITGITEADPGVVTATNTFLDDDIVSIHNVAGMTEVNERFFRVDDRLAASFSLADLDGTDISTSGYTTYTSGGTAHHRGMVLTESVKRIMSTFWGDEGEMTPITLEDLQKETSWTNDNTGRPERYQLVKSFTAAGAEQNIMLWYPGADDNYRPLQWWYEQRVSKLDSDPDVPLLPPQFHWVIVAGAVTRLAENNVQVENAVIWPGIYKNGLKNFKNYNRNFYHSMERAVSQKPYLL
jgi:hypothetical protein